MNDFLEFLQECWVGLMVIGVSVSLATAVVILQSRSDGLETIAIDGCEYIRDTRHAVPVVHKANCKNH